MNKTRLEAFSDGVLAIIITIMVLEIKVPREAAKFSDLQPLIPVFLSYVLSFIYIGIYWNNHHHLLHPVSKIDGKIMWANLHLLFWLSVIPFSTGWMGENHFAPPTLFLYGANLLLAALAYAIFQYTIIKSQGHGSAVKKAIGKDWKGKASPLLYILGIALSYCNEWFSGGIYIFVALMWLVPDQRIEKVVAEKDSSGF